MCAVTRFESFVHNQPVSCSVARLLACEETVAAIPVFLLCVFFMQSINLDHQLLDAKDQFFPSFWLTG